MSDLAQILKPMKDAGMKSLKGRAADGSLPIVREFLAALGIHKDTPDWRDAFDPLSPHFIYDLDKPDAPDMKAMG